MEDKVSNIINDLKILASETKNLTVQRDILRIIERLSNQEEWPNEDELIRIWLRYNSDNR
ncbi:hypothetical protein SAE02_72010 [Skermanella aerolata]|uniref:Uncharacterized protein n=1 Tax=Skermanella aerolata TaxID=393310 RepID=A0A512E2V0_9PROT|nr:hypothetical protein SAE02_72010 [Skermanella aerolata]